jgi:hypothetical protein
MIIELKKKVKELKISCPDLITRPSGKKMYESVKSSLDIISENETILIDFNGIGVIDSSFIDEFIVKLIIDSKKNEKAFFIKLKNISDIAEINIDSVFKTFSNYNKERMIVITDDIRKNNNFFIGTLGELEKSLLAFLRVNKNAGVKELAANLEKSTEETEIILERLYFDRLIKKIKGYYYFI